MRIIIGLASIIVLLSFTVLMPSSFFSSEPTPTEVQIPDERPCEDHPCHDSTVFIQDISELREVPTPKENNVTWPRRPALLPQFSPQDQHRPPSRV